MFMCEQKMHKVKVTQMKEEMVLTYIIWNKKESSYINKTYHQISLSKVYSFLTKLFNKFYNIQGISQHLCNKQNVNILKYTYTYLISMRFTMTYKISQNLAQKITTYIKDHVLKVLT